jgi:phage shock protein PspC (stress-responsive transcriptional regulator)
MNKVIAIHLHGTAFQLEEGGYETLRAYLDNAVRQLGANPDKAEILADIEQAIADKFRALLSSGRNVVLSTEVDAVVREMGPVTDDSSAGSSSARPEPTASASSSSDSSHLPPQPKRLYRLKDGAMLAGVCNGLAAYLGVDVTLLRLVVAILIFFSFGTVAIAYLVGILIIPKAQTPEEKTAASGPTPTAQEFIRRAKEGYYEGFKTWGDREAHRAWKRKFKTEMRDWKQRLRREYRWGWCPPPTPPIPPCPPMAPVQPPCPPPGGYTVALPILSTIKALLTFLLAFALISLIANGSVFGLSLPGGLPVWAGVILLILAYNVIVAPIKAMRRACYYRLQGQPYFWHPFAELWGCLMTLCIVALSVWFADHFIPGFHQALLSFPEFCRHAADNIQQWWTHK